MIYDIICAYIYIYIYTYIYIYIYIAVSRRFYCGMNDVNVVLSLRVLDKHKTTKNIHIRKAKQDKETRRLRSVFKSSCLFLRPRPWQFEI